MKLYKYSPITTEQKFFEAIEYIAKQTSKLSKQITGEIYPISSLTIFSHFPDEFDYLCKLALTQGDMFAENNGPFIRLFTPFILPNAELDSLRIRKPDPYRMQVGCNDFEVPDYKEFKNRFLANNPGNLRLIERSNYEMIEFFDPNFDVLAYVMDKQKY